MASALRRVAKDRRKMIWKLVCVNVARGFVVGRLVVFSFIS